MLSSCLHDCVSCPLTLSTAKALRVSVEVCTPCEPPSSPTSALVLILVSAPVPVSSYISFRLLLQLPANIIILNSIPPSPFYPTETPDPHVLCEDEMVARLQTGKYSDPEALSIVFKPSVQGTQPLHLPLLLPPLLPPLLPLLLPLRFLAFSTFFYLAFLIFYFLYLCFHISLYYFSTFTCPVFITFTNLQTLSLRHFSSYLRIVYTFPSHSTACSTLLTSTQQYCTTLCELLNH